MKIVGGPNKRKRRSATKAAATAFRGTAEQQKRQLLATPLAVYTKELNNRIISALESRDIITVGQLHQLDVQVLREIDGIGDGAIVRILKLLTSLKLNAGDVS